MEDIFESLKTFVLDEDELNTHSTILPFDIPWNKGKVGLFNHDQATKDKIGEYQKKAKKGNKHRLGKSFSPEQKKKISDSLKGNTNKSGKTGKQLSPYTGERSWLNGNSNPAKRADVREKLRQAALNRKKK